TVEAVLDTAPWDWRARGVTVRLGYHPLQCCHWGVYDRRDSTIWIGPGSFASASRLRYVALHELAHAWQWHSGHVTAVGADMARWRQMGVAGFEADADCVAARWGAPPVAG